VQVIPQHAIKAIPVLSTRKVHGDRGARVGTCHFLLRRWVFTAVCRAAARRAPSQFHVGPALVASSSREEPTTTWVVGSLSRKRYTQCVGQWTTTKGELGQLREHRRGPTRTKARKGVRMHERSGRKTEDGRQTQLETGGGGVKTHQHARYECEAPREQTRD
jgi:hypothetical protein